MSTLYGLSLKSSPANTPSSPLIWTDVGGPYLEKLLEERKNFDFYGHDLPICNQLLNQEILRVSDGLHIGFPNLSNPMNMMPDIAAMSLGSLEGNPDQSPFQHQGFGGQAPAIGYQKAAPGSPNYLLTKKLARLDVPVDRFPDYNFVGRLLGPRGNSLKRIEARTGCRLFIRGRGSIKDPEKEEYLRRRPGNAHLKEPLHVIIEAESPANVVDAQLKQAQEIILDLLKPVSKCRDVHKRQQLQELAMLNSLFPEDISKASSSAGPHRSGAMRRLANSQKGKMYFLFLCIVYYPFRHARTITKISDSVFSSFFSGRGGVGWGVKIYFVCLLCCFSNHG